jgi:hypothetical protein
MKIYIAAPYTKGDVARNVYNAIEAAEELVALGHTPFIPHLTHFWHIIIPHPIDFWYKQDLAWLDCCDAVLRLSGESVGADNEVMFAQKKGMPVYYKLSDLPPARPNP